MKRRLSLAVIFLVIVLAGLYTLESFHLFGGAEPNNAAEQVDAPVLVVGSSNFPENTLLGEIYAGALTGAGFEVETAFNLGSREVLFPAMENDDVTVVPEYTGALLDYLAKDAAEPETSTEGQLRRLGDLLPSGLRLLKPSAAQDQETVTCTAEVVERYHLTTLADLGPVSGELVMGGPPELSQRSGRFSLSGLQKVYGIKFADFKPLDVAGPLTVAALREGKIDCANLFSTQSAIAAHGFVSLGDPKGLIESQAVVPLISDAAATPAVIRTLDAVSDQLTTDNLKEMVKRVELDKDDPGTVAAEFLADHGLR